MQKSEAKTDTQTSANAPVAKVSVNPKNPSGPTQDQIDAICNMLKWCSRRDASTVFVIVKALREDGYQRWKYRQDHPQADAAQEEAESA